MKYILLLLILFLQFTAFFIGCEVVDNVILTSPMLEEDIDDGVYPITEQLKSLIWEDSEALIDDILALGENDRQKAKRLTLKLQIRQQQDYLYTKWIDAGGIAIIGTRTLDDKYLVTAKDITLRMIQKRPEIAAELTPEMGFYMVLYDPAYDFSVFELPETQLWLEHLDKSGPPQPSPYGFNGMCFYSGSESEGHTFACASPVGKVFRISTYDSGDECSGLWCVDEIRIQTWSTFIHEMGHAIERIAPAIDDDFQRQIRGRYNHIVIHEGNFLQRFARTNWHEYWAVGVEYWFHQQPDIEFADGIEVPKSSRDQLKLKDPVLYEYLSEWFDEVDMVRY